MYKRHKRIFVMALLLFFIVLFINIFLEWQVADKLNGSAESAESQTVEEVAIDEPAITQIPTPSTSDYAGERAYVLYTVDGDTIAVSVGLATEKTERVRLIGIDTPETNIETKSARSTCYGEEAKKYTHELLAKKEVVLVPDASQSDRDTYGRLLRYVFLDGVNINKQLILQGYAREYTFKGIPYTHQSDFKQAENKAKEANLGLWGVCD